MTEIRDVRLIIKIENKEPIELAELTKSLNALSNQFNSFAIRSGDSKEIKNAKLYIKEIKSGSVILELIEIATIGLIPFIDNTNVIIEFGKHLKAVFDFFIKDKGEKPDLSPTDYNELSAIVNPVAIDKGSQYNVSTVVNGNINLNINLNSIETNAFQNVLKTEIEKIKTPEQLDEIKKSVLLTWYQARNEINSKVGNKGVIEELSKKQLNITFETEELQEEILHGDTNPFNTAYVVDVKIQTIQDKPVSYKVVKLHSHIDITKNII